MIMGIINNRQGHMIIGIINNRQGHMIMGIINNRQGHMTIRIINRPSILRTKATQEKSINHQPKNQAIYPRVSFLTISGLQNLWDIYHPWLPLWAISITFNQNHSAITEQELNNQATIPPVTVDINGNFQESLFLEIHTNKMDVHMKNDIM